MRLLDRWTGSLTVEAEKATLSLHLLKIWLCHPRQQADKWLPFHVDAHILIPTMHLDDLLTLVSSSHAVMLAFVLSHFATTGRR